MPLVTPADLAAFQRCHRQWDFGARARQNLEPLRPPDVPDLGQALREALDIYYFPGMWDWQRQITLPLVQQGFERALSTQREQAGGQGEDAVWERSAERGRTVLERYFGWAPGVDRFSPVQVEAEYDVGLLDPADPGRGLLTPGGEQIRYRGRIGMLAVDANDAYWIVYHCLIDGDWPPTAELADDEEAVAACWAWEQFYLGMAITGTIHNELRLTPSPQPPWWLLRRPGAQRRRSRPPPGAPGWSWSSVPQRRRSLRWSGARSSWRSSGARRRWWPSRRSGVPGWSWSSVPRRRWWPLRRGSGAERVRQHEPSGGGRSIPQHRRMYAVARAPARAERIEQQATPEFRRTWVRRTPAEVAAAGRKLAGTAARMTAAGVSAEPAPSPSTCPFCPYLAPCQIMMAGRDPTPLLDSGYRQRAGEQLAEGRLGGGAWGLSRGAAPPRFPNRH